MQSPPFGGWGGNPYTSACPSGQVLRGWGVRSGDNFDAITDLYCGPPNSLVSGSDNRSPSGIPHDNDGSPGQYRCPDGSAVSGIYGIIGSNRANGVGLRCRNLLNGAPAGQSPLFGQRSGGTAFNWEAPHPYYVSGFDGRSGDKVNQIVAKSLDMSDPVRLMTTPEGIADGCMGVGDPKFRLYQPQSAGCDKYMVTDFCQKYPTDPRCSCVSSEMTCPNKFDKNCIAKNGYRTSDMMTVKCPDVMNCVQYLALSPGAQQLATNTQQNCSTSSTNSTEIDSTNTTTNVDGSSAWIWIMILILVVVLAALGAGAYFLLKSDKPVSDKAVAKNQVGKQN